MYSLVQNKSKKEKAEGMVKHRKQEKAKKVAAKERKNVKLPANYGRKK